MSAEQSQKERVQPREQEVWRSDMSTEQKVHAMGAAVEHLQAIAAGVNIKISRSQNSVPAVKVYKMLTTEAFPDFFIKNGKDGPEVQTFEWYKENENDPLVGYCLLDFSTETQLTYKPLKKDGKPSGAKQKEQDTREAGDDQRDFHTGDIYQVDGFLRTPEKPGGLEDHEVELRSFLSRLEGYQLFLQLDDTEVTEMENDMVVPSVKSYRLDLLFASPLGVTVKTVQTWAKNGVSYTMGYGQCPSAWCVRSNFDPYQMWLDAAQRRAVFIDEINEEEHVKKCRSELATAVCDWLMTSVEDAATNHEALGWMLFTEDGENWIQDVSRWAENDLLVVDADAFAHVSTRKRHIGFVHKVGFEDDPALVPGTFRSVEEWQGYFETYSISNGGSQTMEDCIKTIQETRRLSRKRNNPVRFQMEQGTAPEQGTNQAKPAAAAKKSVPVRTTPTAEAPVAARDDREDNDDESKDEKEKKKMIERVSKLSLTGAHPSKSLMQFLKRAIEGAEKEVQQIGFDAFLGHLNTKNFDVLQKAKPVATELARLAKAIDGMGKLTAPMRRKLTDLQVPFGNAIDPGNKRQRTPAAQSGGRVSPARPQLRVPIEEGTDGSDDNSYSPSTDGSDDDDESEDDEEQGKRNKEQGTRNKEQGTSNRQDATVSLSSISQLLKSHGLDAQSMTHIREQVDKIDGHVRSIKEKVEELPVGTAQAAAGTGTGEAVPTDLVEKLEKAAEKITKTNDMIPMVTNLQDAVAKEKERVSILLRSICTVAKTKEQLLDLAQYLKPYIIQEKFALHEIEASFGYCMHVSKAQRAEALEALKEQ